MAGFNDTTNDSSSCRNDSYDHGLSKEMDEYPNYVAAIIVLLSLIANILVLRGVKLTKHRPLSYYFISNIALAELLDTIMVPFMLHYSTRPLLWIFGKAMCLIVNTSSVLSTWVVPFTLAAFAIYSCSIILRSSGRQSPVRAVFIVMGIIWLLSFALTVPYSLTWQYKRVNFCNPELKAYGCFFQSKNPNHQYYLTIVFIICQLIVPFSVVVMSYGFLLIFVKKLKNRSRKTRCESQADRFEMSELATFTKRSNLSLNSTKTHDVSITSLPVSHRDENRKDSGELQRMQEKLLRMIFWMTIVFVICYCPMHIIYFGMRSGWFKGEGKLNPAILHKLFVLLMLLAKVIHPICFGWSSGIIGRNFVSCS